MPKNGKAQIGIIGCGRISEVSHAPGYKELERRGVCDLVACCDVVPETAQAFARQFGIPHVFTDYREMLALDGLDGVSIATPPFAHKETTVAALRAGKHVLCEKPIAMNAAEGAEMIAAARETGHILTIGHGARFSPAAMEIHRRIQAGDLGEIYYGKAAALRRRGVPARGVFTVKALNGGGPLIDIGVHALDLTMWLMGSPQPVGVFGATYDKLAHMPQVAAENRFGNTGAFDPARYDVEDLCAGMVRFANGASLFLETSWLLNGGPEDGMRSEVYGTLGSAASNPFQVLVDDGTALKDVTPELPPAGRGAAAGGNFIRLERFVDAILGRGEILVHPEESLRVQQIIDALYASAATGKEATIPA
jgi:predicted dehydrogenase